MKFAQNFDSFKHNYFHTGHTSLAVFFSSAVLLRKFSVDRGIRPKGSRVSFNRSGLFSYLTSINSGGKQTT